MKKIFYKYNCSGNTFVIVKYDSTINYSVFSKQICNKYTGVGADGLLIIKEDVNEVLFYNQDGTEALFCGNGLRAVFHYLRTQRGIIKKTIPVLFNKELYYGKVISDEPFCVEIKIKKSNINLKVNNKDNSLFNTIKYKNYNIKTFLCKVGVDHLVILNDTTLSNNDFLNENDLIDLKKIIINKYQIEPNIDILKLDCVNKEIKEITFYERGVGYTKSCGSGSVSIAMVLELMNFNREEYLKINEDLFIVIKDEYISLIGKSNLICWGKYL